MFYIIYKITNLINEKFYIGAHATENINDSYMGSGRNLKLAYKKYGVNNFKKDIMFVFDNEFEMWNKEEELVTEELVKSKRTYNLKKGGKGGVAYGEFNPMYGLGEEHPWFGKKHTEESKLKMAEATRKRIQENGSPRLGKKHTEESKEKNRQSHLGKKATEATLEKLKNRKRNKHTEETKEKISKELSGRIRTDEQKKNIRKSKLNVKQRLVQCPYCNKIGGFNAMVRWKHLEFCKLITQSTEDLTLIMLDVKKEGELESPPV